jgi:hypothetical protein
MARSLRTKLESSSLASITHDPKEHMLDVQFRRTGHVYRYFDVPRTIYNALLESDSQDAFLNQIIKPNFESVRMEIPFI